MLLNKTGIGMAAAVMIGITALTDSNETDAPSEPAKNTLVCKFDEARNSLEIRDTATDMPVAQLDKVASYENDEVSGPGAIIVSEDHIIEPGIVFSADFKNATCAAQHRHVLWGQDKVVAPMVPDLKTYQLMLKPANGA